MEEYESCMKEDGGNMEEIWRKIKVVWRNMEET